MSVIDEESDEVDQSEATVAPREPRRHSSARLVVVAIVCLVTGAAVGALATRVRYQRQAREVVAAVNGATITKDAFFRRLETVSGAAQMRQMMDEELRLQFARERKLLPSEQAVQRRYDEMRRRPETAEQMAAAGLAPSDVKRGLRLAMSTVAGLGRGATASEAEMRRFYAVNTDRKNAGALFYRPETVTIGVVVTRRERDARKARTEIEQKGVPIQQVARRYSLDRSRERGGIIGPIPRGRTKAGQIPGLEETIFGMGAGQVIGPRQIRGAWWIIQCLDRKPKVLRPYREVRDACRDAVMATKGAPANARRLQADYDAFRRKAIVQAFWKHYRGVALQVTQ